VVLLGLWGAWSLSRTGFTLDTPVLALILAVTSTALAVCAAVFWLLSGSFGCVVRLVGGDGLARRAARWRLRQQVHGHDRSSSWRA
jgi:hypothetical protein